MKRSREESPTEAGDPIVLDRRSFLPPYAVIACSVVFFWSISIRALIYTLMPAIATELQLSSSVAGIVIATMLLGYSGGSWLAGWLPGSLKARIMGGVALSLPAAAVVSGASNVVVLVCAALLVGFGVGIYIPLGLALLVEVGSRGRKAYYMAFHEGAATLASFCGSLFVAVMLAWTDWRASVLAWCAVGVLALVAFAAVPVRVRAHTGRSGPESVPLGLPLVYSSFAYAAGTIMVFGLISVLPLILVRGWGLGQTDAASVVGYTRLAGLIGVLAVALEGDRLGHTRVTLCLQTLSLIGAVAMSLDGYGLTFLVGMMVLAAGATGTITTLPLVIAGAYLGEQRERAMAVASGVGGLLGMVAAPALFGAFVDAQMATGPIVFAAMATLLAILATCRIPARPRS